ncbi:MAG TPA: hypothetical protein VEC38_00120 [Candidatus Binataceae bacterium]|nr:hypothetical protein [Candidatus Binataceae bacterium]
MMAKAFGSFLLIWLLAVSGYAQEAPNCPPRPDNLKFTEMSAGKTMSLPPRSKFEFRVAPTPEGCAVTTVITLPDGTRLWLPAGKVYDSPDKTFQNTGSPLTYEAQPAGDFNNWAGWLDTSPHEPGNCDPRVDICPPGSNRIR